jgi:hypothetical protein
MSSYAVTWHEPSLPVFAGKLELYAEHLRFDGTARGRRLMRKLDYRDIAASHLGGRVDGRPALVIERRRGRPVTIASVGGIGALAELAARIAPSSGPAAA